MDIKINNINPTPQAPTPEQVQEANGDFKFILTSKLEDTNLAERLNLMMQEIIQQGDKISKRNDIKDMQRYRILIKDFMNEVVTRSHAFSRENFLDRKGRHRVYGIIRQVDKELDELAQELVKDECNNIDILAKIGQIQGLLLDIFT
ncbi:YaaR family protein [Butyrivibrio proteoclasticus]|uniref:YaaR family protein n=1 Tax=Butyrivibrio proteoclasticus TaxID=43305 RepID=UPI0004796F71|nr:YaaR family protein [Butyrivibrio proteoclasticus]